MKYSFAAAAAGLAALASSSPVPPNGFGSDFSFPLKNGFPNITADGLAVDQKQAGGTLPNTPTPPSPGSKIADFQVIAFNEIHEVAFFTEFLHNVTSGVSGYEVPAADYDLVVAALTAIKAQEELHALAANSILEAYGPGAVMPCKYSYNVSTYAESIALAGTFTDLVLGALQAVTADMATVENAPLAQTIASIIGQEAEQEGWYRFAQGKVPSASPFLTVATGGFAYNALLQNFIVPGSCPMYLDIPTLGSLVVTKSLPSSNSTAHFEASGTITEDDCITYISGQDLPVTVPISKPKTSGGYTKFTAEFPYGGGFSRGLTIAAVTGKGPYANATEVTAAAKNGPGLIEVQ